MWFAASNNPENITIHALHDGDEVEPWETLMTIEGDLADFAHLETIYLGILARQSRIATNVRRTVEAANGKPVLFFPARYDTWQTQEGDGYAAKIGGIKGFSTDANALASGGKGLGTIPHALIASYNGDTVAATAAFDKYCDKNIARIALVDFDNDCVNTALAVARKLGKNLVGVRLDTSGTMVDKSLLNQLGMFNPTGVCKELVWNVRRALDAEGFDYVKIIVSGGFNPQRIKEFEALGVPVDTYAVGSRAALTRSALKNLKRWACRLTPTPLAAACLTATLTLPPISLWLTAKNATRRGANICPTRVWNL